MGNEESVYETVMTHVDREMKDIVGIVPQFTFMLKLCDDIKKKSENFAQAHVFSCLALYSRFSTDFMEPAISRLEAYMLEKKKTTDDAILALEEKLSKASRGRGQGQNKDDRVKLKAHKRYE